MTGATSTALRLGYIRVSTADRNPQLRRDALDQAGCDRIFIDHASGRTEIIHHRRGRDTGEAPDGLREGHLVPADTEMKM
jgi:hypothetical protein